MRPSGHQPVQAIYDHVRVQQPVARYRQPVDPAADTPVPQATAPPHTPRCPPPSRRPHRRATPCRTAHRNDSPELPSLSHAAPSGASEHSPELTGSRQSPRPFLRQTPLSNQGPFPPSTLPDFIGTTSLSATPGGPTHPSRAVGWRVPRHRQGLPVLLPSPSSMRAAATTPAEPAGARVARFPANVSLPRDAGGSASASPVSRPARRSLALRPAWSLNRLTRLVTSECFSRSRYLLQPPRLLPAGATVAGRDSHPLGSGALPRRTATLVVARPYSAVVRGFGHPQGAPLQMGRCGVRAGRPRTSGAGAPMGGPGAPPSRRRRRHEPR